MDLKRTFLLAFVFIEVVRFVELQTISSSEQLLCPEKLANSSKAPCRISWPLIGLAGDWLEDTDDESEYELPLRLELGIRVFHMLKMIFLRFWTAGCHIFQGMLTVEVGKITAKIATITYYFQFSMQGYSKVFRFQGIPDLKSLQTWPQARKSNFRNSYTLILSH